MRDRNLFVAMFFVLLLDIILIVAAAARPNVDIVDISHPLNNLNIASGENI